MQLQWRLSPAERSSADAQLLDWHFEAAGYKVRHVPATLPDILKTEEVVGWEYSGLRTQAAGLAIEAMQEQRAWLRSGVSDYEIALPLHELQACASGTAYYAGLDRDVRQAQLRLIGEYCRELYPRLRLFLFDARCLFSAPVTAFGPNLAVVYVGQFYLAFRESQRVRSIIDHFDWLVREASVDARDVADHVDKLVEMVGRERA